MGIGDILIICL